MLDNQTFEEIWQSFRSTPRDATIFQTLEKYCIANNDWQRLSEACALRAHVLESEDVLAAADLYRKAGEGLEKRLGEVDEALRAYKKSYQLAPGNRASLQAILELCEGAGKWQEWLEVLQTEINACASAKDKLPLLHKMALCYCDHFDDYRRAEKLWWEAVRIDVYDRQAGQALEELLLNEQNYAQLLELYKLQIAQGNDTNFQVEKLRRAAKLCEEHLADPAQATQYYRKLLKIQPQDESLLAHMEKLYCAAGDWEQAVESMQRRLVVAVEEDKAGIFSRMGQIYQGKLAQPKKALSCYEQAWELSHDKQILSMLAPLYRDTQDWEGLASLYQRQLKNVEDEQTKRKLYCRLAELFERELQRPKEAVKCYQLALSIAHDDALLQHLQQLYQSQGKVDELLASYRLQVASATDVHAKLQAYEKMAHLLRERGEHRRVVEVYEEALTLAPKNRQLYEQLRKLYLQLEAWEDLARVLHAETKFLSPQEAIDNFREIALLYKEKLGREEEAVKYYQQILAISPNQRRVLEELRQYYSARGQYQELVEILHKIISIDSEQAIPGYMQIAQIYRTKRRNFPEAAAHYQKILDISPNFLAARQELCELYRETEQWEKFAETTRELVPLIPSRKDKIESLVSLCEVYRAKKSLAGLEQQLRNILELDPRHREAIEQLKQIYEQKKDIASLVKILERETQLLYRDTRELARQYQLIAGYYEKLQNSAKAAFYYEKALFFDSESTTAIKRLEILYTQMENFPKLIFILETKSKLAQSSSEKNNYLFMAGMLWEEQVGDKDKAIELYEQVVAGDPSHVNALDRLKKLYKRRQDLESLEWVYRLLCESSSEPGFLVEVHTQAAQTGQDPLTHYEAVIQLDPKNREAIDGLLKLYRSRQSWRELADIYLKKLAVTAEREELTQLYFELGNLYSQQLDQPLQALEWYNRILASSPKNLVVIQAMEEICRQSELWVELVEVLQQKLKNVQNVEQKKALLLEAAEIYSDKTMQLEKAAEVYLEALSLGDVDPHILSLLKSLYWRIGEFGKVLQIVEKELRLQIDPEHKIELLFEKADLCERYLKQSGASIAALEEVLQLAPTNKKACSQLIQIHRIRQDQAKLLKVIERQAANATDDDKKELLSQQANVLRMQQQYDEAIALWQQCLELDPEYQEARESLDLIYRKLGQWNEIIELYEGELQAAKDYKRMVELYISLGQIWYEQLGKIDEALEMFHQVLELDSNNIQVIRILQNTYSERDDFVNLLEVYRLELGMSEVGRERCIWLLLVCAEIYEFRLQDFESAQQCYMQVLREDLDPKNLTAVMALQRIYRSTGQHQELLAMLVRELKLQPDPEHNYPLHLRIAQLKERVEDIEGALQYYQLLHSAMPEDLFVISRLKELLAIAAEWKEYSEVVERELTLYTQPGKRIPLHQNLMQVYDEKLSHTRNAITHGEAILEVDPKHLPTVLQLQKLYRSIEQKDSLAAVYLREAELTAESGSKERLLHLYLEAGEMFIESVENRNKAIECFHCAMMIDPTSKKALARLRDIYTTEQRWEELVEIFQRRAAISQDPEQIEKIHLKLGSLWENELSNPERALVDYEIAYYKNPRNLVSVQALRAIYEELEKWSEALRFLEIEASLQEEDKRRAAIFFRMGEIWENKLQHPSQALSCYLKVIQYGFHRPSAARIIAIQQQLENYEGLAEILEKDVRHTQSAEERIEKLLMLGEIYHQCLDNANQAIRAYSAILKIDPQQVEALDAMEQLLPVVEDWQTLIGVVTRKLRSAKSGSEQFSLHCKVADIFYTRLKDGKKAISFYEQALELVEGDIKTIHTLQKIYQEWGYFEDLIELCEREIQMHGEKEEHQERVVELYRLIGDTWSRRLFKAGQAIAVYEKLLQIIPRDLEAIGNLARLYRQQRMWDQLVAVYPVLVGEAQRSQDTQTEIGIQLDMGDVYHRYLGDIDSAIACFQRILELDIEHEKAFDNLRDILQSNELYSDLVALLEVKTQTISDEALLRELLVQLGELYEEQIKDNEQSIERYNQASRLDPNNFEILDALERLYYDSEQWQFLADVYQRKLELTEMPEEKAQLYYLLGKLNKEQFNDLQLAREYLTQAIECQDSHYASFMVLAEISSEEGNWREAATNTLLALKHTEIPQEKVSLYTRLGKLYEERLGEVDKAKDVYRLALDINPRHFEALQALSAIFWRLNEFAKMEPLMGRLISLIPKIDPPRIADAYCQWGLVASNLGDMDNAISRFLKAIELVPNHREALFHLAETYFFLEQWHQSLEIYREAYDEEENNERKVEIIHRLASVYEKLSDVEEAIRCYELLPEEYHEDPGVLLSLSSLHLGIGQHEKTLEYTKVLAKGEYDDKAKAKAFQFIGQVHIAAKDPQKAIKSYLRALELAEDSAAKKRLVELYQEVEDWQQACMWNDKCYEELEKDSHKVANRLLHARLKKSMERYAEAIASYQKALQIDPTCIDAIKGIADIHLLDQNWRELANSYELFLHNLPEENRVVGLPIHMALGYLYAERLEDVPSAIKEFQKALALDRDNMGARVALAELKTASPEHEEDAINVHLQVLRRDPYRIESYRDIYQLLLKQEKRDQAFRAHQALSLLVPETKRNDEFTRAANAKVQTLDGCDLSALIPKRVRPYWELMNLTGEYMEKVYPSDIEGQFGIRRRDHLGAEGVQRPIWYYTNNIMKLLGISNVYMYIHDHDNYEIYLENTNPPSLLVSQKLIDTLSEAQMRFFLAKYLFYISEKQYLALKLPQTELHAYFKLLYASFAELKGSATQEMAAVYKRVRSALPRRMRKTLESREDLWEAIASTDFGLYFKYLDYVGNRCALLLSNSLHLSVSMAHFFHSEELKPLEKLTLTDHKSLEAVADLLLFNISEPYGQLRKEARIAIR